MPGVLYQYVNLWRIMLHKTKHATTKSLERPALRDIEWERGYNYWEARGFSGFATDPTYHCEHKYKPRKVDGIEVNLHPEGKKYMPPREYLRRSFPRHYSRPQFLNPAKNYMEFGGRESGKSMWLANCVFYNFGTDGLFDYEQYRNEYPSNQSQTIIAAETMEYAKDLVSKFETGYNNLPGAYEDDQGMLHVSPIYRQTMGSFDGNSLFRAAYKKQSNDGSYKIVGSQSSIPVITLFNNPTAANRYRANLIAVEEVGMVRNFTRFLGAAKDVIFHGTQQYGTIHAVGTAGKSTPQIVENIQKVFYGPGAYNFMEFPNDYDHGSEMMCFFISAIETMNDYMDEEGRPMREEVEKIILKERERLSDPKTGSFEALQDYKKNRPIEPADCFILEQGQRFSMPGMEDWEKFLQNSSELKPMLGVMRQESEIVFQRDLTGRLREAPYPVKDSRVPGAVAVWEPPIPNAPRGLYIAANDPYQKDQSSTSKSLGCTQIWIRQWPGISASTRLVAEYTGRPQTYRQYNEQMMWLVMWYGAKLLTETNAGHVLSYCQEHKLTHFLETTPTFGQKRNPPNTYGMHVSGNLKEDLLLLVDEWLRGTNPDGSPAWKSCRSLGLIRELMAFHPNGNFDRVSTLLLILVMALEYRKKYPFTSKKSKETSIFDSKIAL